MKGRPSLDHGAPQLVDDAGAGDAGRGHRLEGRLEVAVDDHAVGGRAQVGALAADDHRSEVLVVLGRRRLRCARAIGPLGLQSDLRRRPGEPPPRGSVGGRILAPARLADPAHPLVAVEVAIAAVGESGRRAAVEHQEGSVGAVRRPGGIPGDDVGAHAGDRRADETADHVDLMRGLAEHDAAAERWIQLLWPARPVQVVGVVERGHHPHGAVAPGGDQLGCSGDRRVVAVARADEEASAGRARRGDHLRALRDLEGHRLLHEHVLAGARGGDRLRRVVLMWARDVDHLDVGIGAERLAVRVDAGAELGREAGARLRPRVRGRHQSATRVGAERRRHQHEPAAEPDHPDVQAALLSARRRRGASPAVAIPLGALESVVGGIEVW